MPNKFVFSQMFDVRPRTERGELDLEKIRKIQQILDLRQKEVEQALTQELPDYEKNRTIDLSDFLQKRLTPKEKPAFVRQTPTTFHRKVWGQAVIEEPVLESAIPNRDYLLAKLEQIERLQTNLKFLKYSQEKQLRGKKQEEREQKEKKIEELFQELFGEPSPTIPQREEPEIGPKPEPESAPFGPQEPVLERIEAVEPSHLWLKPLIGFTISCLLFSLIVPALGLVRQGLAVKTNVLSSSLEAYKNFYLAKDSIARADIGGAKTNFEKAWENFLLANNEIEKLGSGIISILEAIPGGSTVASGRALVKIGENLALAGKNLAEASQILANISPHDVLGQSAVLLTQRGTRVKELLIESRVALAEANDNFEKVEINSLPENVQGQLLLIRDKLPEVIGALDSSVAWTEIFLEILGHQKAKKYLLVFQNNSEMRPTGGFIGSYGILNLDRGQIKNLFIDGIFNIDGQLYEKVIPPRPIQKISTAWSTHDANWFADFPTSAKKITWFFEKTGGPTVDGVIAITPTVIEELLKITGPIEMPSYGVTLRTDNFVEVTQYKIEVDYDKEQKEPKKILADFTPLLLERISKLSFKDLPKVLEVFNNALTQKHILLYFIDQELQAQIEAQGWAGKLEEAPRDYLNVINTNICGYKTDRMIKQEIQHQAEVQEDGSVIDTLTIIRHHQGGDQDYDWWNQVNANYLRVYVPLGSKLISASGQTLQAYVPPIDYQAQGFQPDPDVSAQESSLVIDPASGTHIFKESSKTVFGNWIFTSPGETTAVVYKYKLPFKLDLEKEGQDFSILIQKQAGMVSNNLRAEIILPQEVEISWYYPPELFFDNQKITFEGDFDKDKFLGLILNLNK